MQLDKSVIVPGTTYRKNGHLYHVRAIVDDEQVVVRAWSHRLGWRYAVEHIDLLLMSINSGAIILVRTPAGRV